MRIYNENVPMTLNGKNILEKKLDFLKKITRPKIIKSIINSRKHGDFKENYEYRIAKEQQKICENKIRNIEIKLLNSKIVDIKKNKNNNLVVFGSTVEIEDLDFKIKKKYSIVGDEESNIKKNKISLYSPIAKELIGKKKNDIIFIKVPIKVLKYKIIDIE